ncbi:MAG: hypothetical protein ACKPKO_34385, partial [Candidatus Fonsibacter sp.]
ESQSFGYRRSSPDSSGGRQHCGGKHVIADHMVTMGELSKGVDGNADVFVITDILSGLVKYTRH